MHMESTGKNPRSHCPISLALEAIGDRWSLLILRDLIMRGKTRYQELLTSEEGIATNILADRLGRLERQGLISKSVDPADRRQFRYAPTRKALDLLPVIFEMARWSMKYESQAFVNPALKRMRSSEFVQAIKVGRQSFVRRIMSRFEAPPGAEGPRSKPGGRDLSRA